MRFELDPAVSPHPPLPSPAQVAWQRGEVGIFVHFTVNTFTGLEWGDGTEKPAIFDPGKLDTRQWARAAKDAGASHMVLTAKHHDGFCLWPTDTTDHSVRRSPYRQGNGDIVCEFVDACRELDLGAGLYLSPWDRHEASYGDSPAYNDFYLTQLRELLTRYGALTEIWFDGACGEGPNGRRQQYDWPAIFATCKQLQPGAVVFGDGGSDVRWVGNELGIAGDPCWSAVDPSITRFPGDAGADRATDATASSLIKRDSLEHGNVAGTVWRPAECDVSIRPGWFYHAEEDHCVRSLQNLVELYFASVGRNAFMLLNVPPTPDGLFHERDVAALRAFGQWRRTTFATDLAADAVVDKTERSVCLRLPEPQTFDILALAEHIEMGQRVRSFRVQYQDLEDKWQLLVQARSIGCRRLERFIPVTAKAIRITILKSDGPALLREISLHRAAFSDETNTLPAAQQAGTGA